MLPVQDDRVWTYEDYLRLPDDGNRYEIIDGKLYVSGAPTTQHQTVSRRLQFLFYELERDGRGFIFNAPCALRMPGADPVEPDLMFLTADQKPQIRTKGIFGPPALIVEILSPSTAAYDRIVKLRKYAECGVPHYWLVDWRERTLMAFRLDASGHYLLMASAGQGDRYEPEDFPGIAVDMDSLFADLAEETESA